MLKIYKVNKQGYIEEEYESVETLKAVEGEVEIWDGNDFKGGYITEKQLSKLVLGGVNNKRSSDYLRMKLAAKGLKDEIESLQSDLDLTEGRSKREIQEKKNEIARLREDLNEVGSALNSETIRKEEIKEGLQIAIKKAQEVTTKNE